MSKHSSNNTLKVANRLAFQDVVVPSRVEKSYAVRIEKGRLVVEVKKKSWYDEFNDVRSALGDRCILNSAPYEVIECVRELAEHARKTGFEPKMMNP